MKKRLLFIFLSIFSFIGYSQQIAWTPIADYPHPCFWPEYFMIGNNLYVTGGLDTLSPMTGVNDLQMYDPRSNTWTQKASLPIGVNLNGANAFSLNGKGYVVNGQIVNGSYNSILWQYNPLTDVWDTVASFPGAANYTATSFSIGPYGFLGLGFQPYTSNFYSYNSLTDSWSSINPFPGTARQGAVSFVINGFGYVGLGGSQGIGSSFNNYTDFYKYDTFSGNWAAIAPFPDTARIDAQAFAINGKGYVVAGMGSVTADLTNRVWEYDPQANSWTQMDTFPVAFRSGIGCSNSTYAVVGLGINKNQNLMNQLWKTGYPTSITETAQNKADIWFYNNSVHILFQLPLSANGNFSIYDLSGKEVANSVLQKGESTFDVSCDKLTDGLYVYKVNTAKSNSENSTGKIIVTH